MHVIGVGIDLQGLAEVREGLVVTIKRMEHDGQVIVGGDVLGIQLESVLVARYVGVKLFQPESPRKHPQIFIVARQDLDP